MVLMATGELDRAALARRVFAVAEERKALEAILHPRIREETARRALALAATGAPYALYEAALIFEIDGDRDLEGVILVAASLSSQRSRLAARDGLTPEEIEGRLRAQLSLEEKRSRATWVLDNDGDERSLCAQVAALDARLRAEARKP
jgi:dephospho-CoA kinase